VKKIHLIKKIENKIMNFENSESNILKKNLEKNIFSIKNKIKNALLAASMVSMINGCHFIPKNNSDN
jgi:hypothetical protein